MVAKIWGVGFVSLTLLLPYHCWLQRTQDKDFLWRFLYFSVQDFFWYKTFARIWLLQLSSLRRLGIQVGGGTTLSGLLSVLCLNAVVGATFGYY